VKQANRGNTIRLFGVLAAVAVTLACGSPKRPAVVMTPSVSTRCPDLAKPDELAAYDFGAEYQLSREAADKLKAAALAAAELTTLSDRLDAELGIACAQIARDLGDRGDWRSGNEACGAAIKVLQDARANLGPKVTTALVAPAPTCLVDATLMTKCASICDSSVPSARIQAECEQNAGRCDGDCDGACESKGAMKCEGTCTGACAGPVKGTCGGRCKGRCDGKSVNGSCLGTCVGTCEKGAFTGECGGTCTGSCRRGKPAICDELCVGSCTVAFTEPKCAGAFKTPEVSTDCRARCELAVMNQTECRTPQVGLVISGSKDRERSAALESAVEKAFPGLLKILFEVGDEGAKRVLNAQAIIDGAREGFTEMASSGGKATAAASAAQLRKCFDEPFKKAAASAALVKTGLDQARGVREGVDFARPSSPL
jgi:hypothetical protein